MNWIVSGVIYRNGVKSYVYFDLCFGEQQNIHTENGKPWRQAEADAFLANSLRHRGDNVEHEACIVLWKIAIFVRAVVRSLFEELIEKVPIRAGESQHHQSPHAQQHSAQP